VKNLVYILFLISILFQPFITKGQERPLSSIQDVKAPVVIKAAPGTYQFIVSPADSEFIFTNDILVQIESLRKENKEVMHVVNERISVRILSRAEINRPGFKPVEEIIYKTQ
jgi:hypothetical protein